MDNATNKAGGLVLGAGAAVLALMASGKLKAAEGHTPEDIVREVEQSAGGEGLAESMRALQQSLNTLSTIISQGQGLPLSGNTPYVASFRVLCDVANRAYRLPGRKVPWGKALVVKALPTNGGMIYVAASAADAVNINSSYSLLANEAVEYEIASSDILFISATVAGEGVVCTVEQESL